MDIIPITVVKPYPKGDEKGWPGWCFPGSKDEYPGANPDPLFGSKYLHEIYFKIDKDYPGRYSVPLLWDKKTNNIVCNESVELLRFLQHAFDDLIEEPFKSRDYYPEHLRGRIDEISKWVISDLNTGVYKAGFAPNQEVYNKNVVSVFQALNRLEELLAETGGPFILGKQMTEVDLLIYPTIIRFDTVYHQHFKCSLGSI
jgi:putative glutathione S-transferase